MRPPLNRPPPNRPRGQGAVVFWDLLTFEHLMTNQVIHLIYWAGLAIIVLGVFGTIGAAVGVAIRDPSLVGALVAIPVLVGGLLVMGALVLLWRSFCEFYVAIFKISEDLTVLRADVEAERKRTGGA
jgi:energy-converting hydrogenase Eha subunit E